MACASSYDGNPAGSALMALRFTLPDKGEPFEFTDAELQFLLDENGNDVLLAAICAADTLIGKYASCVDKTIGKVKISYSQKVDLWTKRVEQLRIKKFGNKEGKKCKTISIGKYTDSRNTDKCSNPSEPDTIFKIGMFDNNEDYSI